MRSRLRDKAEHGDQWPCQNAGLLAGQGLHRFAPSLKPLRKWRVAVKKRIQTFREYLRTANLADCVAQRHFFKGEEKATAGFNAHGSGGYLGVTLFFRRLEKQGRIKLSVPLEVRFPLIIALPRGICLVAEPAREKPMELAFCAHYWCQTRRPDMPNIRT